ncbi:MAG: DinB family protein [Actinomycetota bacterium]|nr:DinB family protein [Actinomycetota bacterium]
MPIVPDDKNWTWVLETACPECGFEGATYPREAAPADIVANAARWRELLAHPNVRDRPDDHTWSALEYGCHVRDVFRLYLYRLGLMLDHDGPQFPNWDQDETAVADRYDQQDPAQVAGELADAAAALAARFATVHDEQWQRTGFRSDGVAFTIDSFTRYFVHDPVHHVHDVEQGYSQLAG